MSPILHSVVSGEGTPLLFVHGIPVDHRILLPLDDLAGRHGGWQRCHVDLPGFGRSPAGPEIADADAVARALTRFVRERYGEQPFAVVGNSFGGQLARQLVAEFGEQVLGLALLAPSVLPPPQRTLPGATVVRHDPDLLARLDPDDAAEYAAVAVWQDEQNWARFRDHVLPGIRAADPEVVARIGDGPTLTVRPESRFTTFDAPCLLVTGRQDGVVGHVDQLALLASYPHMTYAALDAAGHNVHLDQPEQTAALVTAWLDRIDVTGRRVAA